MIVTFYKTVQGGKQEVAGKITFDGKTLQADTRHAKGLLKTLMRGVDRENTAQVEAVLRATPEIYTGSYLRAAFSEGGEKAMAEVEDALIAQAMAGAGG